jgi:carboxylesterase
MMMPAISIEHCLGSSGFYERRGDEAVLLIHGLTGTPAEMRPIAKRLSQRDFTVMSPQLAGLKREHSRVYVCGLSMGALIALKLAGEKGQRVDGLGLLSTTFFYDGWNMPRFKRKWVLPLVLYSPLKYFLSWNETPPYGIKCERTRAMVHAVLENRDALAAQKVGIFRTSAITIRESMRLIRATRMALPKVHSPTLIIHANEDDMASVKNAHFVAKHIASRKVETFFVDDTYHVLTLDKRRTEVAQRLAEFFSGCALDQGSMA